MGCYAQIWDRFILLTLVVDIWAPKHTYIGNKKKITLKRINSIVPGKCDGYYIMEHIEALIKYIQQALKDTQ